MDNEIILERIEAILEQQRAFRGDFDMRFGGLPDRISRIEELYKMLAEAEGKHVYRDELASIRDELGRRIDAVSGEFKKDIRHVADRVSEVNDGIGGAVKLLLGRYDDVSTRQSRVEEKQGRIEGQYSSLAQQMAEFGAILAELTRSQNRLSKIVMGNGERSLPDLVRASNAMATAGLAASRQNAARLDQLISDLERREELLKDINTYGKALAENGQWISVVVGFVAAAITGIQNYLTGVRWQELVVRISFWIIGAVVAALIFVRLQKVAQGGKGKNDHADTT